MTRFPPGQPSGKDNRSLWSALLFSLLVACFVERRIFTDPAAINDDVRNQIYWMARLDHPHLFTHDYIADYFTQPMVVSPVLAGLYQGLGHWLNPMVVSQFLPLGIAVLATFFLYRFAQVWKDDRYALYACFLFNCAIWIFKNMAGGLSRAFIYPLLFLLLWQQAKGRWFIVTLVLWLSALVYPPALLLGVAWLLVEAISLKNKDGVLKSRLLSAGLGILGSLGFLAWRAATTGPHPDFGSLNTNQTVDGLRDFLPGGRIVLFPWGDLSQHWPMAFKGLAEILERFPHLYVLIPTAAFWLLIVLYNRLFKPRWGDLLIPPAIWRLLAASCLLYGLAWVFLFYLYVPERYLQYTFPLIPTFMLAGVLYRLRERWGDYKPWIYRGFALLCLIITSFFWRADLMNPDPDERQFFAFLQTLPETSLIAAPPGLASNIPLYAKRSVLISNEAYIPFHQTYFVTIKSRLKDWLSAYYTIQPAVLLAFLEKYPVDYLVIQKNDFEAERLRNLPAHYYYGFKPAFFKRLNLATGRRYLIRQLPSECMVYHTQDLTVISVEKLLNSGFLETQR